MTGEPIFNWRLWLNWSLLKGAANSWSAHNVQRLGAALAYYTILSLAPLLVIIVAIAGIVFGASAARGEIYWQLRAIAGDQTASVVQDLLKTGNGHTTSGIFASAAAFGLSLLGGSGVFMELRDDLNFIWDVPSKKTTWGGELKHRLYSLGLVAGCGVLMVLSLTLSIALQASGKFAAGMMPIPPFVLESVNLFITLLATAVIFGLIFTVVPDRRIPWRETVTGSLLTAALFAVGKLVVGLYIGRAGVGSTYGAAGSLVALLVWVYYSSQIFLFGAELIHCFSRQHGVVRQEADRSTRHDPAKKVPLYTDRPLSQS